MKKIIPLLVLISLKISAQVGGENVYNFLNLSTSAYQTSLGGKVITLTNDVNQPFWNPASISHKIENNISVNYMNYLSDINAVSSAMTFSPSDKLGIFHAGINYMNYGKLVGADEYGNETGTFKAHDLALSVGHAYKILKTNLTIGVNLKIINSVIENYSSFGIGMDFGVLYSAENKPYSIAFVIRNVGTQISVYDNDREKLPLQIDLGMSYQLENVPIEWHVTVANIQDWQISRSNPSKSEIDLDGNVNEENISSLENSLRHLSIGTELFSEGLFNVRLGYNFRRSSELFLVDKRSFAGFTAGFGIKMKSLKFNYAFSKYHPASNTNTFSLIINLNKN